LHAASSPGPAVVFPVLLLVAPAVFLIYPSPIWPIIRHTPTCPLAGNVPCATHILLFHTPTTHRNHAHTAPHCTPIPSYMCTNIRALFRCICDTNMIYKQTHRPGPSPAHVPCANTHPHTNHARKPRSHCATLHTNTILHVYKHTSPFPLHLRHKHDL